jgi:hypothetical protein
MSKGSTKNNARNNLPFERDIMNEKRKAKVLEILENMRIIAKADMMEAGMYLSESVVNPGRKHQICRGHKACAIGSLWLAGGVKIKPTIPTSRFGENWELPGVDEAGRDEFLRHRHSLRMAHDVLNEASVEYMEKHKLTGSPDFSDPIESLFESDEFTDEERHIAILKIIAAAKRKVKKF